MENHAIRAAFKAKRAKLAPAAQQEAGKRALAHWMSQPALSRASRVGAYWAVKGELPTQALIDQQIQQQCAVFLPKPDDEKPGHLLFGKYDPSQPLDTDRFGIKTPVFDRAEAAPPQSLEVIVMPLVATDTLGNRLGMGAGYYDRTLASLADTSTPGKPILMGWCYEWQVLETPLAPAPWDVPLTGLITDHCVRWFTKPPAKP